MFSLSISPLPPGQLGRVSAPAAETQLSYPYTRRTGRPPTNARRVLVSGAHEDGAHSATHPGTGRKSASWGRRRLSAAAGADADDAPAGVSASIEPTLSGDSDRADRTESDADVERRRNGDALSSL